MSRVRHLLDAMFVQETLTNDIIYLKRMLSGTDAEKHEEAAHEGSHHLSSWLDTDTDAEITDEMQKALDEDEPWMAVEAMTPEQRQAFGRWVSEILASEGEGPPALFMEFQSVLRNAWLIHFSDRASEICSDGFTTGVPVGDERMLGLSTQWTKQAKRGGYNFAYRVEDFARYGRDRHGHGWKYGSEAVVFQASGVKVWHHGDQEPQVIFIGNTARNLVHVFKDGNRWCVGDAGHPFYANEDLDEVVNWILSNFEQYRRRITCR